MHLGLYYKGDVSENCPADQVIDTEKNCMNAAIYEFIHYSGNVSNSNYPAGCYWYRNMGSYEVSFNEVTKPSNTNPGRFGAKGGLCRRTGNNQNKRYLEQTIFLNFRI